MGGWPGSRRLRNLESSEMNMTEIELEDISVMCVVAKGGPYGARAAFDELESKLPSLKGRQCYGTYQDEKGHPDCHSAIEEEEEERQGQKREPESRAGLSSSLQTAPIQPQSSP